MNFEILIDDFQVLESTLIKQNKSKQCIDTKPSFEFLLSHFMPHLSFYTPRDYLITSGGIEKAQWCEFG